MRSARETSDEAALEREARDPNDSLMYALEISVEEVKSTTTACVVRVAMTGGRDGAAEALGDAVPGVAAVASVGDEIRETGLGVDDAGDQRGNGGAGVVGVTAADQDQTGDGVVEDRTRPACYRARPTGDRPRLAVQLLAALRVCQGEED